MDVFKKMSKQVGQDGYMVSGKYVIIASPVTILEKHVNLEILVLTRDETEYHQLQQAAEQQVNAYLDAAGVNPAEVSVYYAQGELTADLDRLKAVPRTLPHGIAESRGPQYGCMVRST